MALTGEKTCSVAMPRFGASDCRCPSHLFYSARPPQITVLEKDLRSMERGQPELHIETCGGNGERTDSFVREGRKNWLEK